MQLAARTDGQRVGPRMALDAADEPPAGTLRILSYNVRHCRGVVTPFISEARTAQVIRALEPDIAGLNEVYRWVWRDQPARLAEMTAMESLFDRARPVQGGEYGNLLLGRFPLREVARIPLAGRIEPRSCLIAEVESPLGVVSVALTHLGLGRRDRRNQIAAILDAVPRDRPFVLLGDFNSQPEEFRVLLEVLLAAPEPPPTFPSVRPLVALDHILFSDHFRFRAAWAPPSLASDHRPLVTELVLLEGQPARP